MTKTAVLSLMICAVSMSARPGYSKTCESLFGAQNSSFMNSKEVKAVNARLTAAFDEIYRKPKAAGWLREIDHRLVTPFEVQFFGERKRVRTGTSGDAKPVVSIDLSVAERDGLRFSLRPRKVGNQTVKDLFVELQGSGGFRLIEPGLKFQAQLLQTPSKLILSELGGSGFREITIDSKSEVTLTDPKKVDAVAYYTGTSDVSSFKVMGEFLVRFEGPTLVIYQVTDSVVRAVPIGTFNLAGDRGTTLNDFSFSVVPRTNGSFDLTMSGIKMTNMADASRYQDVAETYLISAP